MTGITREQYDFLTQGLNPNRVGKNPKGFSHLEAWDVRRHLIRIFGFGGYGEETKSLDLVREIEYPPGTIKYSNGGSNNKTVWTVIYRAEVRLIIKDPSGQTIAVYEDAAAGDAQNQPSLGDAHDNAMKTALSQALKRCAVNLGDQFGLSLYNNGRPDAVVNRSLVVPDGIAREDLTDVTAQDAPVEPEPDSTPTPTLSRDQVLDKAHKAIAAATTIAALTQIRMRVDALAHEGVITADDAKSMHAAINGRDVEIKGNQPDAAAERPIVPEPAQPPARPLRDEQKRRMFALFNQVGWANDRDKQIDLIRQVCRRDVQHRDDITADEARRIIATLEEQVKLGAGKANGANGREAVPA